MALLVVSLIASTLGTKDSLRDGQLCGSIMVKDLMLLLFGILDHYLLLLGEGVVVAADLADESIACGRAFDQQQFETQRAKLH